MRFIKYIALFFLLGATVRISAQHISVEAKMDSTILFIGEQTNVKFKVTQPVGLKVDFPIFQDTLTDKLEILARRIDTILLDNNQWEVAHTLTITSFDSALYYISPFKFSQGNDTIESNALSLKVISVPIDTTEHAISDIKPVVKPPFDWYTFWRIVGIVAVCLFIGVLVFYLIKRLSKRAPKPLVEEPKLAQHRPAHEIALEQLEQIRQEKVWQQSGRIKSYYTQITDVLREYIEARYEVPTMECTSAEILINLTFLQQENTEIYSMLKQLLQLSDLVKFAKYEPSISDHNRSLEQAFVFVDKTKGIAPIVSLKEESVVENTKVSEEEAI